MAKKKKNNYGKLILWQILWFIIGLNLLGAIIWFFVLFIGTLISISSMLFGDTEGGFIVFTTLIIPLIIISLIGYFLNKLFKFLANKIEELK